MEKLLTYYPKYFVFIIILLSSCSKTPKLFVKEFSQAEKDAFPTLFLDGIGQYYQGSVPEQLLIAESRKYKTEDGDMYRELGVPYLKRGLPWESMKLYQKAVELKPKDWTGWRGYLYLYFYRDYENALKDFNATDELTPNFVDYPQSLSVDYMRGICLLKLKRPEDALAYLKKHFEFEKINSGMNYIDSNSFLLLALAHFELGDLESAQSVFEEALKIHPENADLNFYQGNCYERLNQQNKALNAFKKARDGFTKGHFHSRHYVEEFYQIYLPQIEAKIKSLEAI